MSTISSRLKDKYQEKIVPALMAEFGIVNKMAVPKLSKVVLNMGTGEVVKNKEAYQNIIADLASISGQKPAVRQAKVSVASFSVRRGMPVGLKVTLRGVRMYDFVDKLFSIVMPRFRDFRGLSLRGFDVNGNYTLGISEHTVFPEIDPAKVTRPHGMEISFVISGGSAEKSKSLLTLLGMPFEKENK